MAKKRKRGRKWTLLFRKEDGQAVYLYEPLQKGEISKRKRAGWKVIS